MGCFTFVKLMMVLFNLLIFLAGLTLSAMGIWASVNGSSLLQLLGSIFSREMQFVNVGFFSIAVGALLVLLGLLGCCGAHKESKCLLLMFFSILLIIFMAGVAAGVVALAYSSFAERILRGRADPALHQDYGSDPAVTNIWNSTMAEGCFEEILLTVKDHANVVGRVTAGIGILQIAAMTVSMYLHCRLDKRVQ